MTYRQWFRQHCAARQTDLDRINFLRDMRLELGDAKYRQWIRGRIELQQSAEKRGAA